MIGPTALWALGGTGLYIIYNSSRKCDCWLYRDDIGQRRGIKGYEEQAMIDRFHWPFERFWSSHNALTIRRGFKVFTRSCNACHSMVFCKYDFLLKKAFR
jgi:hypothetical protein